MTQNQPPAAPNADDSFDIQVRGYNRQQVAEYMARSNQLLATLEQHLAVARADVQRARAEAERAQEELEAARSGPSGTKPVHEEVSSRLSQILRLAAEEAAQERADAEAEIAALRERSTADAQRLVTEAQEEAGRHRDGAREDAERHVVGARTEAEETVRAARAEAEWLSQDSIRRSQELLQTAQMRAAAIDDVSGQRLETLTATHGEAVLRLGQIRDVLADLLGRDAAAGSLAQVVDAVMAPLEPDADAQAPDEPAVDDGDDVDATRADETPAAEVVEVPADEVEEAPTAEADGRPSVEPDEVSAVEPDRAAGAAAREPDREIDLRDERVPAGGGSGRGGGSRR